MNLPTLVIALLFAFVARSVSAKERFFADCKACQQKCNYAGYFYATRTDVHTCSCDTGYLGVDKMSCFVNCKRTTRGRAYRGDVSRTISEKTCQAWASQAPHKHKNSHSDRPDAGLEKNYCRNPDNEPKGPWCYTTDRNTRWEYCAIPFCKATESPAPDTSSANSPSIYDLDKAHVSNCNSCTQLCLRVGIANRVLYECSCNAGQKLDSDGRGCTESPGARSKYWDRKDCYNNCKKAGRICKFAGNFKKSRRYAYVCV